MQLTRGTRLGSYEIVSPLGAGGMGEVYRALDTRLGRSIALKVLPEAVSSHPDRLARFEREAKTVAALSHPNIVVLHSIEESGGVRFLTMELVEGQSLDVLVTPGGLPLARVLDISIALADALAGAHESGIVHRDLKPANVMVTPAGRIKVLDFGLAKLTQLDPMDRAHAVTMDSPISSVGQVVGTVPYMAPEQIRGESVDARADVFSLGILIYELTTGRRPFAGGSAADVSSSILRDAPKPLRSERTELPRDLERIVARCLEKDRERRFQTAKDVRNELEIVRREVGASPAPRAAAAATDVPSIAVLPFVNRSRSEDDEYFSDGLADELSSVLVKVRGLRVAARTSAAAFKGKEATIAEVGRTLNVASVLEGSVRKAGNRVRITVQLVKVEDGFPMWSETYDRTLDDIFAVQDDIAQSVVKELRTTLLGGTPDSEASGEAKADIAAAAQGRGENPEAHRLYLEGKHLIDRFSTEDVEAGIRILDQALALDPSHALAWVQLARAHGFLASYGVVPTRDGYGKAREAIQRALAITPDLAEAHAAMAPLKIYDLDWSGADREAKRALELAPGSADALASAANVAGLLGRFREAEDLQLRALERDPLSSRYHGQLAMLYRATDRPVEAEASFRKSLEMAPGRITAHHILALVLADQGRDAEALTEVALEPADWARLTALAYVHHKAGRKRESDQALQRLQAEFPDDCAFQIAFLHCARGEVDEAFASIDRGLAAGDPGMVLAVVEPSLRPLHGDPRWKAFMKKLKYES